MARHEADWCRDGDKAGRFQPKAELDALFEAEGALDRLEAFASENGPRFYGLPLNTGTVTLERRTAPVPEVLKLAAADLVPFHAGEELGWSLVSAG